MLIGYAGAATSQERAAEIKLGPTQVTSAFRKEANDFFLAKDWAHASAAYETIANLEPSNWNARFRLGISEQGAGRYDRAIEAYLAALKVDPNHGEQSRILLYDLACAYGLTRDKENAFHWLERAIQAGFDQVETLNADKDLTELREDPRFKELVAKALANLRPCSVSPEAKQFGFWLGEWEVRTPQGQLAGTSSVQSVVGDCAILENWTSARGASGKSLNFFNREKGWWQQTWLDDHGRVIEFEKGEFKDGSMKFSAESQGKDGTKTLLKLSFFDLGTRRVRQLGESSLDGGKSWKTNYDLIYERKK